MLTNDHLAEFEKRTRALASHLLGAADDMQQGVDGLEGGYDHLRITRDALDQLIGNIANALRGLSRI